MNLSNMTEEEKAQRKKDYSKAYRIRFEEEIRQINAEKRRQGKRRKYGARIRREEDV